MDKRTNLVCNDFRLSLTFQYDTLYSHSQATQDFVCDRTALLREVVCRDLVFAGPVDDDRNAALSRAGTRTFCR